ncbi:histidine phosphatase family protein, partial [Glycomyces dulcitolivorans]|uniref:histidine phosphatase family protein n=1 Tax=Glycomyces dulcitolivorans TaxID=2200759 RepID=UPI000DD4B36F
RLRGEGLRAVFASPLLRARQTAAAVAGAAGLAVRVDARVTERINWDGRVPFERFADDWARTTGDRDFAPESGDSSRAAGARFRAFLEERGGEEGPVAVACHGGVTVDLLRTLLGDAAVPEALLRDGVPSGAITVIAGLEVVSIAMVDHLVGLRGGRASGKASKACISGGSGRDSRRSARERLRVHSPVTRM